MFLIPAANITATSYSFTISKCVQYIFDYPNADYPNLQLFDLGLDLMCMPVCNNTCQLWWKVALCVAKPEKESCVDDR